MKKKNIIFITIIILLIIVIILCTIRFTQKSVNDYLTDNSIENGVPCTIQKSNIINEKDGIYKKGDRINIYLNDDNIEYDYNNKPYMENVLINDVEKDSLIIWIPFEYKGFTMFAEKSPLIKLKISAASDTKGPFKGNRELRDLLNNKYAIPEEK